MGGASATCAHFVLKYFCMKIFRVVLEEIYVPPSSMEEQLTKLEAMDFSG